MFLIEVIVAEDDLAAKEMLETGVWMPGPANLPEFVTSHPHCIGGKKVEFVTVLNGQNSRTSLGSLLYRR
jgi:hypothetical protein